jgi:signal transduction histidine kinase
MWKQISLRKRIYVILAGLSLIALFGGFGTIWYSLRIESLINTMVDRHFAAFRLAESMEIALVNQKGFASYYFIDGNPGWLEKLGEYRQAFKERLRESREQADTPAQQAMLAEIATEYDLYVSTKDRVLDLYRTGKREEGLDLHQENRGHFFKVLALSEAYKSFHTGMVKEARINTRAKTRNLRIVIISTIIVSLLLALSLVLVFVRQVLEPLQRLTREAGHEAAAKTDDNEIIALSRSVRELIEDVDQSHVELDKSRANLRRAERMAMVGKLAAGMAHSIRNPFTAVKMRLFSLNRSLALSDTQQEDFDVISEEIRHIDTIVQNFLEFSRPPKLKMQRVSPSDVVDMTCQLLKHRLRSYDVDLQVVRDDPLPEVDVDPEQLKEVLVNLVDNACQAIGSGGSITITESLAPCGKSAVALIEVADDGPGIPEDKLEKVFNPFFTSKEDGTGLGLSIAARIIEEHSGTIAVASAEDKGATFTITLPVGASAV